MLSRRRQSAGDFGATIGGGAPINQGGLHIESTKAIHQLGQGVEPRESEFVWSDIWHLNAHHSTALEGNTLVPPEVEILLEKGRAVAQGVPGSPGVRRRGGKHA